MALAAFPVWRGRRQTLLLRDPPLRLGERQGAEQIDWPLVPPKWSGENPKCHGRERSIFVKR